MHKKILSHFISLMTVFKHLFKSPITLEYPEKKISVPEKFKGKPIVNDCISCGTCMKVCPTGAIRYSENDFQINLNKCILCGNCAYYCPKKAIKLSNNYELATLNKSDLILNYTIENKKTGEENV
ncbi:4Fe-4S binding protein [bacterium]|nr:4Fe-4S binding protein [bacterium]